MALGDSLLAVLSIVGLVVGFSLGFITDRGFGLVAVIGAVVGVGVGIYVGQAILAGGEDEP